jgi:hypothetical protein
LVIPPYDTHPNCKCYLRDVKTGERWLWHGFSLWKTYENVYKHINY